MTSDAFSNHTLSPSTSAHGQNWSFIPLDRPIPLIKRTPTTHLFSLISLVYVLGIQLGIDANKISFTVLVLRMANRIWKEAKQQPGTAGPGNRLGSCLVSFHFLWAILSTSTVDFSRTFDDIFLLTGAIFFTPIHTRIHANLRTSSRQHVLLKHLWVAYKKYDKRLIWDRDKNTWTTAVQCHWLPQRKSFAF